ncbi:MAG: M50 family metallopeptidase [Candidatus Margulisiibacteriota bacterium]|jgi:hypothetical protein
MLKAIAFTPLFVIVFLRTWIPLVFSLLLHEMVHHITESIVTGKRVESSRLINPFGSFFYPFINYCLRMTYGASIIVGWTKPKYNKDLNFGQNFLVAISGPLFNLGLAVLLAKLAFSVLQLNQNMQDNLLIWFLEPLFSLMIKLNLLIFLVNLLPFYPFDMSRLWMPYVLKKNENLFFLCKVLGLVLTIVLFLQPAAWSFIDKVINAFVSLLS